MSKLQSIAASSPATVSTRMQDYLELCKPRVVLLMLLTSYVGMHLATPGLVPWSVLIFGTIGIGFAAGAAAAINHIVDRQIDATMGRTKFRPIPSGKIPLKHAVGFATILSTTGLSILYFFINPLTAFLTFFTLVGYAGFYTLFLKRTTPQNIVIGGAAGAAPPLLGWTAVTGHWAAEPLLLVLIIFVWTPPHFWSLAIARYEDYAKAKIPMLPVTHGIAFTKQCILLYTLLLFAVTLLPFVINMSGLIYLVGTLVLNGLFIGYTIELYRTHSRLKAMQVFRYSIVYLMVLFVLLLFDHYF